MPRLLARSLILISAAIAVPAGAAASTVMLSGTVQDNQGTPVAGAEIQVLNAGTPDLVASATTDSGGLYIVPIAPGTYDVKALPPAGSTFQATTVLHQDIAADTTLNFVLVAAGLATLSGKILDPLGNAVPAQNVALSVSGGGPGVGTTTDPSGSYSFAVAPGSYQIAVESFGSSPSLNIPQNYRLAGHSPILSLSESAVLDLPLPAKKVSVHVQDPAGNPVAGVGVTTNNTNGCCSFLTVAGLTFEVGFSYYSSPAVTDASGDTVLWLFRGTSGGSDAYTFTATPPPGSPFVPTSTTAAFTMDTSVTITLALPVTLSGRVLDPSGNGVPDQSVTLSVPGSSSIGTTTDSSGAYSFEVAPGSYQIAVESFGSSPSLNVPQNYQVARNSPLITLTENTVLDLPLPAKEVSVHVHDPAGNPVAGVGITTNNTHGCCSFLPVAGFTFEVGFSYYNSPATTDASGDTVLWLFRGTSGGSDPYTFTATPTQGSPFVPTSTAIPVTMDTSLTITLALPVTLSGRVLDPMGNGVPDQSVLLSVSGGGPSVGTTTDPSGAYSFEVAPGSYEIGVASFGSSPSLNVPQNYQIARNSPVLALTENAVLDLQLPAKKVSVHVQDPAGNPVAGVGITTNNTHGCCSFLTVAGFTFEVGFSYYSSPSVTDASGDTVLWLFRGTSGGTDPYTLTATPPPGSPFLSFSVQNVIVTSDLLLVIALPVPDADGDGVLDTADACAGLAGPADRQGCPVGDANTVILHIIDRARSGACPGGAGSCDFPIVGADVRVFDRNDPAFQVAYDGKNPSGRIYDLVFENDIGRVGACTTDAAGQCTAGEANIGDYLVIVRYADPSGMTVYTGQPKSPTDFVDTDGDGQGDLATKDFHLTKVHEKDGTLRFSGGSKTVATWSIY